jgi:hypothetical protein
VNLIVLKDTRLFLEDISTPMLSEYIFTKTTKRIVVQEEETDVHYNKKKKNLNF